MRQGGLHGQAVPIGQDGRAVPAGSVGPAGSVELAAGSEGAVEGCQRGAAGWAVDVVSRAAAGAALYILLMGVFTVSKELLFSLRAKDFRVDTFRSGGPGGQNQNKRETGVRITHLASGAVGEARDERSQGQNKRIAFRRLVESQTFQVWLRIEAARAMLSEEERRAVERRVEGWMSPENLLVEFFDTGRWVPAE